MKIVHALISLDPVMGGVPAVAVRLAVAQAALGHQVEILSADAERRADIWKNWQVVPGIEMITWRTTPQPRGLRKLSSLVARGELRPFVADADIVVVHGVWETYIHAISRVCARYVVVTHAMLVPRSLENKRIKKWMSLFLRQRRMLREAAFVHSLTRAEEPTVREAGAERVEIIPNGVFLSEFEPLPSPAIFREQIPELGDSRYVLFLSRLHEVKGIDLLLSAFTQIARAMPDIKLVVAGPDTGWGDYVARYQKQNEYGDRVFTPGLLSGRVKWSALFGAAVFCLPSRQEGFSIALLEAMATKTPIVISRECNFPEAVEYSVGRQVSLDSEELAGAVIDVLSDPGEAAQMGQRGRRLVEEQYTWSRIAERSVERYAQACRNGL